MHSPIERNVPQHKMNTKKTKARSSCFLSHLAWKRERAYFYFGTSVTYLLKTLTDLQSWDPHRTSSQ